MSKKSNKHLRNSQLYPIDRELIFFNDHVNDYLIFSCKKRKRYAYCEGIYIEQMLDHSTFNRLLKIWILHYFHNLNTLIISQ